MDAMAGVPREAFVPDDLVDRAYDNNPLPIGQGQTISQPFIVALMTDLLEPEPHHKVLEIGAGCGYQAVVLAEIVASVYSIEYLSKLGEAARRRLADLGYDNVSVATGDGRQGWPQAAPFDGIIVTAGAEAVQSSWIEQIAPGGRIVVPLGRGPRGQELIRVSKDDNGRTTRESILPVAFVPLAGG
jgi:protein-L-isoaspartate(D-aspartate) O-methyltransferase